MTQQAALRINRSKSVQQIHIPLGLPIVAPQWGDIGTVEKTLYTASFEVVSPVRVSPFFFLPSYENKYDLKNER